MHDIPTYNHSQPDPEPESKPSFFHYAAKFSLFAPILSIVFVKGLIYGLKDVPPPWGALIAAGLGFLLAFIFLVSLVLAIVALAGIPRHGKEGILVNSLLGMLVSLVLLGIWGANFVHGFQTALQNRGTKNSLSQTVAEENISLKKEFVQQGSLSSDAAKESVQKMKSAYDKAAHDLKGNDALVARAGVAYFEKMQVLLTNYTAALLAIKSPYVLNMSAVRQREQLSERKVLVNSFMEANEKLLVFTTKAETIFHDELVRMQVPPEAIETALKSYRQAATEKNFLTAKIRMTDQRIGVAMLGMLDTLDANWGGWKYNPEKKKVIFQDTSVVNKYNEFFGSMTAAAKEQAALQSELVKLPEMASTR